MFLNPNVSLLLWTTYLLDLARFKMKINVISVQLFVLVETKISET